MSGAMKALLPIGPAEPSGPDAAAVAVARSAAVECPRTRRAMIAAACLWALGGCAEPQATGFLSVQVPLLVPDDGTLVRITVAGEKPDLQPLEGYATVQLSCGTLNGQAAGTDAKLWLAGGEGSGEFACDKSTQPCCKDLLRIDASLEGYAASGMARFAEPSTIPDENAAPDSDPSGSGSGTSFGSFAARNVYLFGTLAEGACGWEATAALDQPTRPGVGGFYCTDSLLMTSGGKVIYWHWARGTVREFNPDPFEFSDEYGRWRMPTSENAWKNDHKFTVPCTADTSYVLNDVIAGADGSLLFQCRDRSYYDSSGKKVVDAKEDSLKVWSINGSGYMLLRRSGDTYVRAPGGTETRVAQDPYLYAARARTDGFWIAHWDYAEQALRRSKVLTNGTVVQEGVYQPVKGYTRAWGSTMDGDGNIYSIYSGVNDVVLRMSLDAAQSAVVYTEKDAPKNNWEARPPKLFVRIHGSDLFTGP